MSIVANQKTIYVGIQATRGVAIAAAAGNAVRVFDDQAVSPNQDLRMIERADNRGWGMEPSLYGGRLCAITFSWMCMPAPPTAGSLVQEHLALYQLAGFAETAASDPDGSNPNIEIAPSASADKFATIIVDTDGKRWTLVDCVCNSLAMSVEAGGAIVFTGTFIGYGTETDAAQTQETYKTTLPFVATGGTFSLNGVSSYVVKSLSLDAGIEAPARADITDDEGFAPTVITNMKPTGGIVIESVLVATQDLDALLKGGVVAMSFGATQDTRGFTITTAKAKITDRSPGDDGGVMTDELTYMVAKDGGALDLKLKWT